MKILITGGAGFIGSHIVDILINKNHNVIVMDNLSTGNLNYVNKKAKFYNVDITKNINYIFEKEKPDIVIHMAAQTMLRKSLEDPLFDAKTNIIGTLNILEACRKNNIKRLIYTSTGGARFGEPEYLPVDEKHSLNPCSPYGISKHTAEHYIWMYNKIYELDYLIFCFGNVYGPRDSPKTNRAIPVFIDKILKSERPIIFGDGEQTRDFIYVLDLAEFIVNSIDKNPKNKLFNLANGEQISVNKIFNILKEISKFEKDAIYEGGIKGEVRDIQLNINLVKEELDWESKTSFEEGLKKTFEWFNQK